ncbi:MAG: phosphatidylserine decarboxylase [Thermoguttaceae bacterium]|nr:phosphatidylserine decarboxylase [Thermoguttaceae bacterium]MDW8037783.1 phosphatidylserine decarboxylase [Thermoguttaceae bacterium]
MTAQKISSVPEWAKVEQPEPLPAEITGVQPGGVGWCARMELAWGRVRRWYLKRFRPGYVRRMAELRRGSTEGAPHEILDPRDLKYCRNVVQCDWAPEHDPFRWRERLPFARWGLAELVFMGGPLALLTSAGVMLAIWQSGWWWLAAAGAAMPLALLVWFFRDPPRQVPQAPGLWVSPADGTVVEITRLEEDPFIGSRAVRVSIFLSIFDVHVNRSPCAARVVALRYQPGEFLNAMRPQSAQRNENLWIGLEALEAPYGRLAVRVIAGAIARRIVCVLRPGEELGRGQKFGMIKLGSRTELILPDREDLELLVEVGSKVRAGSSPIVRWQCKGISS